MNKKDSTGLCSSCSKKLLRQWQKWEHMEQRNTQEKNSNRSLTDSIITLLLCSDTIFRKIILDEIGTCQSCIQQGGNIDEKL